MGNALTPNLLPFASADERGWAESDYTSNEERSALLREFQRRSEAAAKPLTELPSENPEHVPNCVGRYAPRTFGSPETWNLLWVMDDRELRFWYGGGTQKDKEELLFRLERRWERLARAGEPPVAVKPLPEKDNKSTPEQDREFQGVRVHGSSGQTNRPIFPTPTEAQKRRARIDRDMRATGKANTEDLAEENAEELRYQLQLEEALQRKRKEVEAEFAPQPQQQTPKADRPKVKGSANGGEGSTPILDTSSRKRKRAPEDNKAKPGAGRSPKPAKPQGRPARWSRPSEKILNKPVTEDHGHKEYFWNGTAVVVAILALVFWGALFVIAWGFYCVWIFRAPWFRTIGVRARRAIKLALASVIGSILLLIWLFVPSPFGGKQTPSPQMGIEHPTPTPTPASIASPSPLPIPTPTRISSSKPKQRTTKGTAKPCKWEDTLLGRC